MGLFEASKLAIGAIEVRRPAPTFGVKPINNTALNIQEIKSILVYGMSLALVDQAASFC